MSAEVTCEDKFLRSVTELTDLIHELVEDACQRGYTIIPPLLVKMGGQYLSSHYSKEKIIQGFIKRSHAHWDAIHERKEEFFASNANAIFGGLPLDNVDAFKKLFTLKDKNGVHVIAKEDRAAIWDFFDSLVKISIRYIFEGRRPSIRVTNDGKKKPVYLASFFDEVELERHAKNWGIKLEFTCAKS